MMSIVSLDLERNLNRLLTCNSIFRDRSRVQGCALIIVRSKSTSSSNIFSYTSIRAKRRRRSVNRSRQRVNFEGQDDHSSLINGEKDTRTIGDILWPNPFKDEMVQPPKLSVFEKIRIWRNAFKGALSQYRQTWVGFTKSKGFLVEDEPEPSAHENNAQEGDKIVSNVKRNARFLKDEAERVQKEFRDRTGIHSFDDLRKFTREMFRLASDCVNEFMSGYRKGRDDEVEKIMAAYLKDLEPKNPHEKKKKRRTKRRVLNLYNSI